MKWNLSVFIFFPLLAWGTDSTAVIPGTYIVPSSSNIFILAQGMLPTQSVVPPVNEQYMRPGSSHVSSVPGCYGPASNDSLTCPIGPSGGCPSNTTPSVAVSFAGGDPNTGSGSVSNIAIQYTFETTTGGIPTSGSSYQLVFSNAYMNETVVNGGVRVQWIIYCQSS